jgi:hypothetical protein
MPSGMALKSLPLGEIMNISRQDAKKNGMKTWRLCDFA